MEGAAVEFDQADDARLPVRVHAARRVLTAHGQRCRLGQIHVYRVAGELGLGADELEAGLLPHPTAPAVAAHEPTCADALLAGTDGDLISLGLEAVDGAAALNLDSDGQRASRQHAFKLLQLAGQLAVGRAGQSVRPARRLDVAVVERDACEVTGRPALLRSGCHRPGPGRAGCSAVGRTWRCELIQQSTAIAEPRCWSPRVPAARTAAASWPSAGRPASPARGRTAWPAAARRPGTDRQGRRRQ